MLLSIKLLCQYQVRIKLQFGLLFSFWVILHIKDLIIYHCTTTLTLQDINWITIIDVLIVPLCAIVQLEIIKSKRISNLCAFSLILPFIILFATYCIVQNHTIIIASYILSAVCSSIICIYTFYTCSKLPQKHLNRKASIYTISAFLSFFLYV